MSLERFRRTKMVVLNRRTLAFQAARAMADNHVGAILVAEKGDLNGIVTDRDLALAILGGDLDPKTTSLGEVMSEEPITCDIKAEVKDVLQLMREHTVRRIPITEGGRLAGLATLDDLIADGSANIEEIRSVVVAQLDAEAPLKPAGLLHPEGAGRADQRPAGRARALVRAEARAQATYDKLVAAIQKNAAGLDRDRADRALLLSVCMLCRRLAPPEAQHLIAQLPSKLRPRLEQCLDGPDRAVTTAAI
jgi:CBS domain-containing protein